MIALGGRRIKEEVNKIYQKAIALGWQVRGSGGSPRRKASIRRLFSRDAGPATSSARSSRADERHPQDSSPSSMTESSMRCSRSPQERQGKRQFTWVRTRRYRFACAKVLSRHGATKFSEAARNTRKGRKVRGQPPGARAHEARAPASAVKNRNSAWKKNAESRCVCISSSPRTVPRCRSPTATFNDVLIMELVDGPPPEIRRRGLGEIGPVTRSSQLEYHQFSDPPDRAHVEPRASFTAISSEFNGPRGSLTAPVIIDLPQAVNAAGKTTNAFAML